MSLVEDRLNIVFSSHRSMYMMKAHVMPPLYFHGLVKGWWEGPTLIRKALR
jgi:hypothetical protein